MRHDAPFLVKRYAPTIGRPQSPRRIVLSHQAYSLEAALTAAREEHTPRPPFWPGHPCWIERRGQSATRRRGRLANLRQFNRQPPRT